MINNIPTLNSDSSFSDGPATPRFADDLGISLSDYLARVATMTREVIPRRVTLYSAVFGVGHEESDDEPDPDPGTIMNVNRYRAPVSTLATLSKARCVKVGDGSALDGEQLLSPISHARQSLENLSLRSPRPLLAELAWALPKQLPLHMREPSPMRSPMQPPPQLHGQSPEPSPIQSPEPAVSTSQKRRIAPSLLTSELPAVSTGNLVACQEPLLLIPPPTLSPLEARQQIRSAFEESRFTQLKPFRTYTRRHLAKRPTCNPDPAQPPVLPLSAGSTWVPKFIDNVDDSFWFCRHASFTQDHIFALLQAGDGSQQQQQLEMGNDMVIMQSWVWRLLRSNDRLLYDDLDGDDDEEVLPVYGESDDEGEYSDGLIREIGDEQREVAARQVRLDTVERERVAEVWRIMQQRLALFASEWRAKQQPRLELRASSLWRSNVAGRTHLDLQLAKLIDERLPKIQRAVVDSGEARKNRIISRCESLRVTSDQISEIKWLLELTSGPQPLPMRQRNPRIQARDHGPRRNTRKSGQPQRRVARQSFTNRTLTTLPGLSGRPSLQGRFTRAADSDSDVDVNNLSDDSMDDFIDDGGMGPEQDLVGTHSSTGNGRLVSLAPSMTLDAFATELARYSSDAMFSAVVGYIQQMARGDTSFSTDPPSGTDPSSADAVPAASIALRVWGEFKHWLHTVKPTVRVQYANFEVRDKAKRQLDHLLARQLADANVEISINPPPQWVPKQYARVAASMVLTPLLHMRSKDRPSRPAEGTDIAPRSSPCLFVDGKHSPEVLHVMHDNGVAQRAAFSMFYNWRKRNDGTQRSPAILSSDDEGRRLKQNDAETSASGRQRHRALQKRARDDSASSDDDSNSHVAVDEPILETEAELAKQAVLSSRPVAVPIMPVVPARDRRRNIRPIREEDAEVLETRRIQRQAEEEIHRRLKSAASAAAAAASAAAAAAPSPSNSQSVAASQASVIIPIDDDDDDDDDDEDEEAVVSGTMPAVIVASEPATIKVDIGQIGAPTLVNLGHFDDESDIMIPGFIAAHLKSHQLDGVRFMWRNLVMLSNHRSSTGDSGTSSSGRRIPSQHGCVLAHSMGLGKTLQTIAFIYTLLNAVSSPTPIPDFVGSNFNSRRVLILCPPTIQANWATEFWKWTGMHHTTANAPACHRATDGPLLPPGYDGGNALGSVGMSRRAKLRVLQALRQEARRVITQVINFGHMRNIEMRLAALRAWHQHGGVLIMGYQGFRELMKIVESRNSKRAAGAPASAGRESSGSPGPADPESPQVLLRRYLLGEGPCLVIADEGHVIKNSDALLSKYVSMLRTKARVCLTGYPLQNNLVEYWTMVNFCSPRFLGDLPGFRNSYVNPIENGLYLDSSPADKRTSTLRMKALHGLLEGIVDRQDMSVLHNQLPRKAEYVIACPLTPAQMRLYQAYLASVVGIGPLRDDGSIVSAASGRNLLLHGSVLLSICNHPAICHRAVTSDSNSLNAAAVNVRAANAQALAVSIDESDDLEQLDDLAQELDSSSSSSSSSLGGRSIDWCKDIFASYSEPGQDLCLPSHCLKVVLMLDIIRHSIALGERVLIFTRSIPALDYLQKAVDASGILHATSAGRSLRIDGSTNVALRQDIIDSFNAPNSPHYLFFISSGTGSIGVNLVAASRVIIFDVGWNPLYDEQAVARAYRYGQRRRVYVYRLITSGTWEDNMFSNNMFKVAMTRRVVDRQTTGRRNTRDDMRRYFQCPPLVSPTIPADDLARLADEYQDDAVFTALLGEHASNLAKVTPQATLVAEEEEHLQEGDTEIIKSMVVSELQRFGQIPATILSPAGLSATSMGLPIATARSRPMQQPVPPFPPLSQESLSTVVPGLSIDMSNPKWYDIRRQKTNIVKYALDVLMVRLAEVPARPPQDEIVNGNCKNVARLLKKWHSEIVAYINEGTEGAGRRCAELIGNALPGLCTNMFCILVVCLHVSTDEELQQYLLNAAGAD
ncbi:hypothetical protein IW152_002052 [Coemansia sp. BCRC 34962]|nr:hypothetical protein IW152_002052 [Coemansia sp. BCRC 34962]